MCFTISFILLSSCLSNQNFKKKEKMEALASAAVFKFSENAEVSKAIDSVARFTIRPVRLVLDLINQELDERFFNSLESKVKDKQKRDKRSELMRYVKDRNISVMSSMLKEEERAEWQDKLINLNEEIELTSGSTTTYACLILCKGCYNEEVLEIITGNFPKRNQGLYPIHLACMLGSEDFVKILMEKDKDCLGYVSKEEGIRMNSLAYASMFNHENLVKKLLELGIRSHEGYILSVILGNKRIEELFMEKVYGGARENIANLKEVTKDLGRGNNVFHILPLIEYLRKFGDIETEQEGTKLNFMQGKKEEILLCNLVGRLRWMDFTIEDIAGMLKSKNDQNKTALEYIIMSGDEELYSTLFDAIKKEFEVPSDKNLEIVEPDQELLSAMILSSAEVGCPKVIEEILNLSRLQGNNAVYNIYKVAELSLYKAVDMRKNEIVFLICKHLVEGRKLEVLSKLNEKGKEDNNIFLISLLPKLESSVHTDLSYKAVDLRSLPYGMSLERTEGDYNRNIFHYAVMFGNEELVSSIVKNIEFLDREQIRKLVNKKDTEGKTVFHLCFEYECTSILKRLLNCVTKIGDKCDFIEKDDKKGNTPLHYVKNIDLLREAERFLGGQFVKVCNYKNKLGRNVLMQYVSELILMNDKSKEVVKFLLESYDYTSRDSEGKSLEMLMVEKDDEFFYDCLKSIVKEKRFNKNQKDNAGNNLLHYIARFSKKSKFLGLIDDSTYCNLGGKKNKNDLKARYLAVDFGNTIALRAMLERYQEIKKKRKQFEKKLDKMMIRAADKKQNSVIAMLIEMKSEKAVESIFEDRRLEIDYIGIMKEGLKLGSKVVVEKVWGYEDKFALDMDRLRETLEGGVGENSTEALSYVVDKFASKVELQDERDKEIVFTVLLETVQKNKVKFFGSLMMNEVIGEKMINYESRSSSTLLGAACYFGRIELVNLMLEGGAGANHKDRDGRVPLHAASHRGYLDICELLLQKGADITIKDDNGDTPLHCAAVGGFAEICEMLIERGASLDAENNKGDVPLAVGVKEGHLDVCRLLVEKGSNTTGVQREQLIQVAIDSGNTEIKDLLLKGGGN